jgi:hypothetical protein
MNPQSSQNVPRCLHDARFGSLFAVSHLVRFREQQAFKKVPILGDATADQLVASMQFIHDFLVAECDSFHVRDAFDLMTRNQKRQMTQRL